MGRRRGVCSPSSGEASIMDVDRLRKGCERVWKWLKIGRKRFCPTKEERQMEVWMKEGQKGDAYLPGRRFEESRLPIDGPAY
jgi:hypothetical protein